MITLLTVASDVNADGERVKRVLMISTGSRFSVGFPILEQSILDRLRQLYPEPLEFYGEYLDLVRFPSESYRRLFRDFLSDKYADDPPDLIMLTYVGNLGVAEKFLNELFPNIPAVSVGLTEEELPTTRGGGRLTGLAQRSDPAGTIKLLRRLQPDTRRLVLIGGTAEVDRHVMSRTQQAVRSVGDPLEVEVWNTRSLSEILDAVTSLPPQTAILFTRMFRDGAGRATISSNAAQSVAKVANAPVYVMSDPMLGTGAVGGSMADVPSLGKRAAELAYHVLSGADSKAVPLEIITQGTAIFDWRALQRWGIPESRLPPNSVVRFKPQSLWDQYYWYIIAAMALIAVQTAVIGDLLLHRARRRRAEAELRENHQLMDLAASAGELGLWSRNLKTDEVWLNPHMRSLFGLEKNETLQLNDLLSHIHPDDRTRVAYNVESAQLAGMPFEGEFRVIVPNGRERWVVARGKTVGEPHGARRMGVVLDISERKKAEEALRESEENFRRLVESTSAVIWQADMENWMFTYVGPQAAKFLGYPLEQWYEKDFWVSHIHPDDKERAINTCLTLSKTVEEFEFEYRMIRPTGEVVWVHDVVNCQQQNGKPKQLRGLMLDITARKRIEQALFESEERFRNMADSAPVMIWMSGTDKLCNYFNKAWLDFTGRSMAQELGNGWAEGVHSDDYRLCLEIYTTAFDARKPFKMEYRLRRHDDEYRWIVDDGQPRYRPDGTFDGYIGSCLDITERKLAEERFRLAVEASPSAIVMINPKGEIVLVNTLTEKLFGYPREELIGKTVEMLVPHRFRTDHPAHRMNFFAAPQSRAMGAGRDLFAKRKDGSEFQVEIGLNPIQTNEGTLVLTAIVDITERKRAESELRRNREELAHVTRITAMGELAASLAHELNQPLTAILSNAQAAQRFLAKETAEVEEVRDILHDIVEDNNRASEVIRRMRALVKKEELQFNSLDFAGLTREIVALIHSDAILRNVRVDVEVGPDLPFVRGDKVQLQQVLLNLLLNAFDAMKDCAPEEREVAIRIESKAGSRVEVSVSDRGSGLTSDKLDKVFEPFFTTKRDGLGMGLSISRSIIEAHGGHLWVRNNAARGATFYFTLQLEESSGGSDRQEHRHVNGRSAT